MGGIVDGWMGVAVDGWASGEQLGVEVDGLVTLGQSEAVVGGWW